MLMSTYARFVLLYYNGIRKNTKCGGGINLLTFIHTINIFEIQILFIVSKCQGGKK